MTLLQDERPTAFRAPDIGTDEATLALTLPPEFLLHSILPPLTAPAAQTLRACAISHGDRASKRDDEMQVKIYEPPPSF